MHFIIHFVYGLFTISLSHKDERIDVRFVYICTYIDTVSADEYNSCKIEDDFCIPPDTLSGLVIFDILRHCLFEVFVIPNGKCERMIYDTTRIYLHYVYFMLIIFLVKY